MPSRLQLVAKTKFEEQLKLCMDEMHRQFEFLFQRPLPLWLCVGNKTEDELKKLILEGLHRKILLEFGTWCALIRWKNRTLGWDVCRRTTRRK